MFAVFVMFHVQFLYKYYDIEWRYCCLDALFALYNTIYMIKLLVQSLVAWYEINMIIVIVCDVIISCICACCAGTVELLVYEVTKGVIKYLELCRASIYHILERNIHLICKLQLKIMSRGPRYNVLHENFFCRIYSILFMSLLFTIIWNMTRL